MKMTCLIVEDEPMARNLLRDYIDKIPSLELVAAIGNPLEALNVLREQEIDVLFLDVQMPNLTGISLLKVLKKKPIVILTTAYSEYAIEGYELDVTDYLLKPITFERFLKAVEKAGAIWQKDHPAVTIANTPTPKSSVPENVALDTTEGAPSHFIFVKDGTKLVKLRLSDIMYIEGLKDYVKIHTPGRNITTLQRLKALEDMLPADKFIRIHHSYIVAVEWIDVIHRDQVEIGSVLLPVSDTYRKGFRDFITNAHSGFNE
jgi:DNA-binding LytR/AlgR family response regulator